MISPCTEHSVRNYDFLGRFSLDIKRDLRENVPIAGKRAGLNEQDIYWFGRSMVRSIQVSPTKHASDRAAAREYAARFAKIGYNRATFGAKTPGA
jgi:hypothetical protein